MRRTWSDLLELLERKELCLWSVFAMMMKLLVSSHALFITDVGADRLEEDLQHYEAVTISSACCADLGRERGVYDGCSE